jgi:hypothetical protein
MRLDSHSGLRGVLVNADTARPIRWAIWADTDTGEYEAFRADPQIAERLGIDLASIRYRGQARLRFIPARVSPRLKPTDARDAADSMREAKLLWAKPIIMLPGQECDERYCHALASWQTAMERVIEPIVGADGQAYKRSIVTEIRNWCPKHYRWPQRVSLRGVESETEVTTRPQ